MSERKGDMFGPEDFEAPPPTWRDDLKQWVALAPVVAFIPFMLVLCAAIWACTVAGRGVAALVGAGRAGQRSAERIRLADLFAFPVGLYVGMVKATARPPTPDYWRDQGVTPSWGLVWGGWVVSRLGMAAVLAIPVAFVVALVLEATA